MEPKPFRYRLLALGGLFVLCLAAYCAAMFDAQIVHGAEYRARSARTNTRVETVEASRGILTDRNGKVLVSNHAVYTLEFDASSLPADTVNDALLRLLALLEAEGILWDDPLPLSAEAPYAYDFSVRSARSFVRILTGEGLLPADTEPDALASVLPAPALFGQLCTRFGIDPASADARALAGLRYALAAAKQNSVACVLAYDIPVTLISLLKDGAYAGARVGTSSVRVYETDAAAHLLGRVGQIQNWDDYKDKGYARNDLVGIDGAEYAFEAYLRGSDGRRLITSNAEGKVTSELYSVQPEPGGTVALTIDIDFQEEVERILDETVTAMTEDDGLSRAAAAAVVQIGTGDVLALASWPTYSLKTFYQDYASLRDDPLMPMFNRATMGAYAPGSTFKPLSAVAALETGVITPQTTIRTQGQYRYYDQVYNCWIYSAYGGSHGTINVTQAITESCNYFFYDVGRMTGISTLARYASAFGLGEATGIELPERTGSMTSPDYVNSLKGHYWTDGLTLQAAIGQAYDAFTPLQLANYIATLAGGGTRYAAHLLRDVREYDGVTPVYTYSRPPLDVISIEDRNLTAVLEGMRALTQTSGGVGYYFRDCLVSAGAKTGTAQTGGEKSNGVFVCFAPYEDPQIAVALVIEKGGSGGALASSAVQILNAWFTSADAVHGTVGENTLLQ